MSKLRDIYKVTHIGQRNAKKNKLLYGSLRRIFLCVLCVNGIYNASAQQDPEYSMYRFNGLYLNPAYAGSHDDFSATAMYRDQWLKIPGAPQSASVALHSPLPDNHIALGLLYTYDQIGVAKTNSADACFAYRILVGRKKDIHLSFGISAGFANYRADLNSIATTDPNDPSFEGNSQNRTLFNVGTGFYTYGSNFFAGISVPNIMANKLDGSAGLFATSTGIARQYQNLLITGGYLFDVGKHVKLLPSILFIWVPEYAPLTMDFNLNLIFIDRIFVGAGYRLNDSYSFSLAVNVTKQVRVGYNYDLTVSSLSHSTTGTHEVMLGFDADVMHHKPANPARMNYF
jgi:type IX secretion system PorP/SprF family membrane protein